MWWNTSVEDFRREIRAFADTVVAPAADRMDASGAFEPELMAQMRQRNLLSMLCPKEYGGPGSDTLTYAVAVEELSRVCGSTGITVAAANSLGVYPVSSFGTSKQRQDVLPGVARNGAIIAFGLTEPGAGSDASGTKTTAVREGDSWVLNGGKCFITNPHFAEWIIATAVTRPGQGARGISSFLLHKDTPGFSVGKKENKMGLRGSDTATLHFDGVKLPLDAMLGPEGEGFKQFMKTLDGGRISIGAMALGLAQGSLEVAARYVLENKRLGGDQGDHQSVQFKLADMATQVEAARHLVYNSAHLKDTGRPFAKQSAMAKLYASEVGRFCAEQAMKIMGIDGFTAAGRVERHFRDVKLCEIGEGTSEIQRIVISRYVLKEFETVVEATAAATHDPQMAHVN